MAPCGQSSAVTPPRSGARSLAWCTLMLACLAAPSHAQLPPATISYTYSEIDDGTVANSIVAQPVNDLGLFYGYSLQTDPNVPPQGLGQVSLSAGLTGDPTVFAAIQANLSATGTVSGSTFAGMADMTLTYAIRVTGPATGTGAVDIAVGGVLLLQSVYSGPIGTQRSAYNAASADVTVSNANGMPVVTTHLDTADPIDFSAFGCDTDAGFTACSAAGNLPFTLAATLSAGDVYTVALHVHAQAEPVGAGSGAGTQAGVDPGIRVLTPGFTLEVSPGVGNNGIPLTGPPSAVPEPHPAGALVLGVATLAWLARRRRTGRPSKAR